MQTTRWLSGLGVLVLAGTLAACTGGSAEPEETGAAGTTPVHLSIYTSAFWAIPATVAQDNGYFEEAGIEAFLDPAPSGLSAQQLLASNTADIAFVSPAQAIAAEQQGQDVVYMCGGYQVNPASIVAPVGSDLPSVDDGATWEEVLKSFKGKTIGIPTPLGTGTANLMVGTLASVGLQDGDYTLVNIGTGATAQAAIVAGQVDAANVITPNGETMVAGGIAKELLYMPDGPKSFALIGGAWEARRSWVEQNPEVAKGFCEAMAKAYDYVQDDANKDEVNDLIRGIVGETNDVGIEALDLIRGRAASLNADITEEQFETTQSTLIDLGIVDGATPVEYTDAVQISR